MAHPAPPVLTVRYDGSEDTFAAGHDVVIGRDLRADVRVAHPLASRAHLLLRFDQGRWMAIDNGSLNGVFVNGQRVPLVDIRDGQSVNLGNPDGPRMTFEVGYHTGQVGRPPETMSMRAVQPTAEPSPPTHPGWPSRPQPVHYPGPAHPSGPVRTGSAPYSRPHPTRPPAYSPAAPTGVLRQSGPPQAGAIPRPGAPAPSRPPATLRGPAAAKPPEESNLATRMLDILRTGSPQEAPAGALTIGRGTDNDIVITDVLASRHHAMLIPTPLGTEIRDNRSIHGTFVNGVQIESAILTDGDVVTIGNVDLEFTGGTLVRRTQAATKTGGLEVNAVCFDVAGGKRLLNDITLIARPGTLTALIGGSGAGKSTLSRLIAGYTCPTSGSVTFEGHNIHTEYASLRSRIGMVPQDYVVHRQLTVNQALGYAAELRLPPDTSKADRD
ncbi:MAG: FHA domain-containing protein, partial [Mycobacterium sp.]